MKESVKGVIQDGGMEGGREGVNTKEGWTELRGKWERKGDGLGIGNKLLKEEAEDREDTQSVSWSLADWHGIWSISDVSST